MGPGGHPALRNTLVRRALAHGINRPALVRGVVGEIDPKLRPLESVVFLAQSSYYRPKWTSYDYRPAMARRLLERAGCRRGADGIYSCAGARLSLRFVTSAGIPPRERLLSLVQAQLRLSGIEVVPTFAPPAAFLGTILERGDFDVALFGWINDPNTTGRNLIFGCGGRQNYTGYCRRSVTRALGQADRILDARQQARVLNQADAQIARDVPVLPLFQIPFTTALRTTVRNFVPTLNPLTNAENWWRER
jgi:peptide/nickel transport system substrate-binding protein